MDALFVIDVSNVCRDAEVPPVDVRNPLAPRAERLHRLVRELRGRHTASTDMRFVADDSLCPVFAHYGLRHEWVSLCRLYDIEVVKYADPLILEYAYNERRHVVSRDHYLSFRRQQPWILDYPERFLAPCYRNGAWALVPSGVRPVSDTLVTEAEEKDDLKDAGLDRSAQEILDRAWRCTAGFCELSQNWERRLLVFPVVDRYETVRCPACHEALTPLGPRGVWAEVKVKRCDDGREIYRFPVAATEPPVVLGRGQGGKGISLDAVGGPAALAEDESVRISRAHVRCELDGDGHLLVTDLGSQNGTYRCGKGGRRRLSGGEAAWLVPAPARGPKGPAAAGPSWVELGGVIRLERSARKYVTTLPDQHPWSGDGRVTEFPA